MNGSLARGSSVIHAGTVCEEKYEALLLNLKEAFAKAELRDGRKRSAAGGKQGHQRTPAMIEALLEDAKAALEDSERDVVENIPRGGFTDVGRHTGGEPRDTAWPLVREVFRVRLFYRESIVLTRNT